MTEGDAAKDWLELAWEMFRKVNKAVETKNPRAITYYAECCCNALRKLSAESQEADERNPMSMISRITRIECQLAENRRGE